MKINKFYLFLVGLYLFVSGASYGFFTYAAQSTPFTFLKPGSEMKKTADVKTATAKESKLKVLLDVSGPKTEMCPLNGQLYTKAEKEAWSKRRPLLVMIENHQDSRPQSGLLSTDIVYETVAEGGITRFMGVFYCAAQANEVIVGPVRSARTYFLDWASEYGDNPLYAHVGGANCNIKTGSGCANGAKADALGQIIKYGWGGAKGNDLNQFSIGYPTFLRDYDRLGHTVATEHTVYSSTDKLWKVAANRGWNYEDEDGNAWDEDFVPWKFRDENTASMSGKTANYVAYDFWSNSPAGDYSVSWQYDPQKKVYLRSNAGQKHLDLNYNQQLNTRNIVVMYSRETHANDGYPNNPHLLYATIGSGKGVLFQEGQAEDITWKKKTRKDRTIFTDKSGKEVKFAPGRIWISNLPLDNNSLSFK